MDTPSRQSDDGPEHGNLTVSPEFRDAVRVAKAKEGLTYEEYLRKHLPDNIEDAV